MVAKKYCPAAAAAAEDDGDAGEASTSKKPMAKTSRVRSLSASEIVKGYKTMTIIIHVLDGIRQIEIV
jgi:hypothetical protein